MIINFILCVYINVTHYYYGQKEKIPKQNFDQMNSVGHDGLVDNQVLHIRLGRPMFGLSLQCQLQCQNQAQNSVDLEL